MEKLKMHSPDLTQDNVARIRELFPDCVTEAQGADGGAAHEGVLVPGRLVHRRQGRLERLPRVGVGALEGLGLLGDVARGLAPHVDVLVLELLRQLGDIVAPRRHRQHRHAHRRAQPFHGVIPGWLLVV